MPNDESWTCPYCGQVATLQADNESLSTHLFNHGNKLGRLGLSTCITVCPNSRCREFVITAVLREATDEAPSRLVGEPLQVWWLKPQSSAKAFPDYIPGPLRQDYEEACLISGLSPRASAALCRRCLQGMIRDFWGIKKARLIDEISELRGKVDPTTWQALEAVRTTGKIGEHMQKETNYIADADLEEAALLLQLVGVLFEEWYIRRHDREERMNQVIAAAQTQAPAKSVEDG